MLDIMERRSIRKMSREGMTQEAIAYVFDVSQATISRVLQDNYTDPKADRMEAFGLVTREDGCYITGILSEDMTLDHEYKTPSHEVDWCTPDAELEAEQELEARFRRGTE